MDITRRGTTFLGILTGLGAIALIVGLGIDGFFGGMLQGAGLATVLLGVYWLGMRRQADKSIARGEEPDVWLPSRDNAK